MHSIVITTDRLEYSGILAAPAFALFMRPEAIVEGLYYAFLGLHQGVESIMGDGDLRSPADVKWEVDLVDAGMYRMGFARIDWARSDAWSRELDTAVLSRGDAWLRSTVPGPAMHSHHYTYSAHAAVAWPGTARDVLTGLGTRSLESLGESQGTGLTFHGRLPDGWQVQFTLDHSQVVEEGLFFQIIGSVVADSIDQSAVGGFLLRLVHDSLGQLGLHVENGVG